MADRIQQRRDTAARWSQYNPILLEGEVGYELDTDQYKVGDGVHTWNDLPYRGDPCLQQTGTSTTTPMSQKAVTDELELLDNNIGIDEYPTFNTTTSYSIGSIVKYDRKLYKFTSVHTAGAWTGNDVEKWSLKDDVTINNLLSVGFSQRSTINQGTLSNIKCFKDIKITDPQCRLFGINDTGYTQNGEVIFSLITVDDNLSIGQQFVMYRNEQPIPNGIVHYKIDNFGIIYEFTFDWDYYASKNSDAFVPNTQLLVQSAYNVADGMLDVSDIVSEAGNNTDKAISQKFVSDKLKLIQPDYQVGYATSFEKVTALANYKHCIIDIRQGVKIHNGVHNEGLGMVYVLDKNNSTLHVINTGSSPTIETADFEISENDFLNSISGVNGVKYLINLAADGYIEYTDVRIENSFKFGGNKRYEKVIKAEHFTKNDVMLFSLNGGSGSFSLAVYGLILGYKSNLLSILYGDGENTFILDDNYDYFVITFTPNDNISEFNATFQKKSWEELNLNPAQHLYEYKDGYNTSTTIADTDSYKHIIIKPQIGIKIFNGIHNEGLPMIVVCDKNMKKLAGISNGEGSSITKSNYKISNDIFNNYILGNYAYYLIINLAKDGYIDFSEVETNDVSLAIGSKFPIVGNNTLEIFKYSITDEILNQEKVDLVIKVVSGTTKGRYKSNAYYVNGNDLNENLVLKCLLYDNKKALHDEKEITIIPITKKSSPSSQKNILVIGDSYTNINVWLQELKRRLTESDGNPTGDGLTNLNFIGTVNKTVPCEGYSGKDYEFFISSESPFYKNGSINIAQYASDNAYDSIDYVLILLGANRRSPDNVIKSLLDAFIDYNPNVRFLIGSNALKNNPYGWSSGQLDAGLHASFWQRDWLKWNRHLDEELIPQYSNAFYVDVPSQIDLINNWQTEEINANNRNSTAKVLQGIDNVHPANSAYYQIADAFYNAFHYFCLD